MLRTKDGKSSETQRRGERRDWENKTALRPLRFYSFAALWVAHDGRCSNQRLKRARVTRDLPSGSLHNTTRIYVEFDTVRGLLCCSGLLPRRPKYALMEQELTEVLAILVSSQRIASSRLANRLLDVG